MIWYGNKWKWDSLDLIARHTMSLFKDCTVLDVGCGYGRLCEIFNPDKYLGIDFSEEMIKLANKKFPQYKFEVQDKLTYVPEKKFDIIFALMAGDIKRFEPYANIATITIGSEEAVIKYKDIT